MTRFLLLAVALVLSACSGTQPGSTSTAGSTSTPGATSPSAATDQGGIGFKVLDDAAPAVRDEASIEAAFDAEGASALLDDPPSIDFDRQGILCLYLGERTGKWGFSVNALNLEDGALHIAAAERAPRAGDTSTTHPAQCLAVDRNSLPAGKLAVTADDTVSDEFIVDGTIEVPSVETAP